ncbi:ERF superfamily protein [Cellulophaga phage phi19:1]|uniref:ERF superfamily protein n=1 Tax=Cellulophaga phage phi19:1 TaxID=1327970 RepID=R9ZVT8_9CAUD|nr:Erf-like ssDNA annealing protein [Cellulophaga phage phi19:1]AGO47314.1 ERF superfamily protein [Cellulophaga phage phi19:1]
MEIYKKLLNIQKEVKGLSKDKSSHNYDYVTGNKLLSFIKPIMDEQGLLLKTEILDIENTRQDYKTKFGEKSEILSKVMMRFTWVDTETGETDVNLFGANGQNDWEKGLGSALTYAERYFLLKYFHIATDEDDVDNAERKQKEEEELKGNKERLLERLKVCDSIEMLNKTFNDFSTSEKALTQSEKSTMHLAILNKSLTSCDTLEKLAATYKSFSKPEQTATVKIKDEMKLKLTPKTA